MSSFCRLQDSLDALAAVLIADLTKWPSPISEGVVLSEGPWPYRRLDCDGRALAYVRTRLRKRLVRIDVSGLWLPPGPVENAVPNAGGTIAFVVRDADDIPAAVRNLSEIVRFTRERELERRRAALFART